MQINNSEIRVIQQFIYSDSIVFDVGANVGNWSAQVLYHQPDVELHLFEPIPQIYHKLIQNYADQLKQGNIFLNNIGLSRPTLDQYCEQNNIYHIHFLKIDTEGAELDVLLGAHQFLKSGSIDIVQFGYGDTYHDTNTTLKQIYDLLDNFNYYIFKIESDSLEFIPLFLPEYEDYQYSNFLAINARVCPLLMGDQPTMLDLNELCINYHIEPLGVIHIGAHEGQEIDEYLAMNVQKMLLIEANPDVYDRLKNKLKNYDSDRIEAINFAISNYDGKASLRVTSSDQSSSLLPLKLHSQIYPQITEDKQIEVTCKQLDSLLQEDYFDATQYNLLNIDIQGAEMMALQGAKTTLKHIEAINIEVNYVELYEGCVLVHELDSFLREYGFERVATISPYHQSWGDAFYVKKSIVTMFTIGKNGRFANQIFQYAFLRIYAKNHDLRIATSEWIGQVIFGHNDESEIYTSHQLSIVSDLDNGNEALALSMLPEAETPYTNVDFVGYFQYHTKYYYHHKDFFQSLFQPIPSIACQVELALERLRSFGKTIISIHLRRGDYGSGIFFRAPTQWYRDWLEGFWDTLEDPVLFIASDDIDDVIADFADYMPITSKDLDIDVETMQLLDFYLDFYLLSHCDVVAISNSSFSFAACMLNKISKFFFRPHLPSQKLIPFDPWNSDILLKDKIEDAF